MVYLKKIELSEKHFNLLLESIKYTQNLIDTIIYSRAKKSVSKDIKNIEAQIKKQYNIIACFEDNIFLAKIVSTVLKASERIGVKAFPKKIVVNSDFFKARESSKEAQIISNKTGLLILNSECLSQETAMSDIIKEVGEFAFAQSNPQIYKNKINNQIINKIVNKGHGEDEQELKFFLDYFNGVQQSERTEPNLRLIKDVFAKKVMDIINASSIDKHTG